MKISIVLGPFQPMPPEGLGAVEKVWFELSGAFAREGHRVTVVGKASSPAGLAPHNVEIVGLRGYRSTGWLAFDLCKDLAYAVGTLRYIPRSDVIVTNSFWLPLLIAPIKALKGRVVVHVARFPKGQMRLYRGADILQAISSAVGQAIALEAPALRAKIRVLGYPVDIETFRPETSGVRADPPVVLYAGRIHPEKGIELLVRSFRHVAMRVPGARLEIIGPVSERQGGGGAEFLHALQAAAAGLDVRFLEPIADRAELARAYRRAACFCYPSLAERGEAFGLAVLEAMAAGAPCIVSALECFRDFVRDDENAVVFDHRAANAEEQLAESIVSMLSDRAHARRISERGCAEARRYESGSMARAYIDMFRSIPGITQA